MDNAPRQIPVYLEANGDTCQFEVRWPSDLETDLSGLSHSAQLDMIYLFITEPPTEPRRLQAMGSLAAACVAQMIQRGLTENAKTWADAYAAKITLEGQYWRVHIVDQREAAQGVSTRWHRQYYLRH